MRLLMRSVASVCMRLCVVLQLMKALTYGNFILVYEYIFRIYRSNSNIKVNVKVTGAKGHTRVTTSTFPGDRFD